MSTKTKFNIQLPTKRKTVNGVFIKLKNYAEFEFFIHKAGKKYHIREFYTGRKVGWGHNRHEAVKRAYSYLKAHIETDKEILSSTIAKLQHINSK